MSCVFLHKRVFCSCGQTFVCKALCEIAPGTSPECPDGRACGANKDDQSKNWRATFQEPQAAVTFLTGPRRRHVPVTTAHRSPTWCWRSRVGARGCVLLRPWRRAHHPVLAACVPCLFLRLFLALGTGWLCRISGPGCFSVRSLLALRTGPWS